MSYSRGWQPRTKENDLEKDFLELKTKNPKGPPVVVNLRCGELKNILYYGNLSRLVQFLIDTDPTYIR